MHTRTLEDAGDHYSQTIDNPNSKPEEIQASLHALNGHYNNFLEEILFNNMTVAEKEFTNQFIHDVHPKNINTLIPCMMNCPVVFYNLACFNFLNNQPEKAQIWCDLANNLPEKFLQFHQPLIHALKKSIVAKILHGDAQPSDDKVDELQGLVKFLFSQIKMVTTKHTPDFFKKTTGEMPEAHRLAKMVRDLSENPSSANMKRFVDGIAIIEISLKKKNMLPNDIKITFDMIRNCIDQLHQIKQQKLN